MPRAFVVIDLGFGDAGKGSIVEALVRKHNIRLVCRFSGGSQCAHNVVSENGTHHTFATWGAGTLAGAATLLTKDVLIDPFRLWNEGNVLESKGVVNPFSRMNIDARALVITPFHRALNRLREIARGKDERHGSCGIGIGETAKYALDHPDSALRIGDLWNPVIATEKLIQIRKDLESVYYQSIYRKLVEEKRWSLMPDVHAEVSLFTDEHLIEALLWRYRCFTHSGLHLLKSGEVEDMVSRQDTVWEGAQGVLLDEDAGFHPYTTWSRVTARNAREMLAAAGVDDITTIGVLRTYGHRHGIGPFPSEDETIRSLVEEPHNTTNNWQNIFRVGRFDTVLARYALKVAGGTQKSIYWGSGAINKLALTHMDRTRAAPYWKVVTGYGLDISNNIPSFDDWSKRERLTSALMGVRPEQWEVAKVERKDIIPWVEESLGVSVGITSYGPKYTDKRFVFC